MADYDLRTPLNYRFGSISASVDAAGTQLHSVGFQSFPADLTTEKYVPVSLVDQVSGNHEVVWVVGHVSGSTEVTVERSKEGTTARNWSSGTVWNVAPTTRDTLMALPIGSAPADAHLGMRIVDPADGRNYVKSASGWQTYPYQETSSLISQITLEEDSGGMTFNDIPQTFRHLQLWYTARTTANERRLTYVQFNSDTTGYDTAGMFAEGSSVFSFRRNGTPYIETGPCGSEHFNSGWANIADYAYDNGAKSVFAQNMYLSGPGKLITWQGGGIKWNSNAPVTSIRFDCTGNFRAGTHVSLYGVKW